MLNLILCLLGLFFAVITILRAVFKKRRDNRDEEDEVYADDEEEQDKRVHTRMVWLVITILAGILGIVLFLVTENLRNPMVLMDVWTVVNAIIFAIEVIAIALTFHKKTKEEETEDADA